MRLIIINGPNINMIGIREPNIYGETTYQELIEQLSNYCREKRVGCEFFQSNHEGDIVDKIQESYGQVDGIIINAAAFTHSSISIYDALKSVSIPSVEVHISDIYSREEFRKINYIQSACEKSFIGLGIQGYFLAVDYFTDKKI